MVLLACEEHVSLECWHSSAAIGGSHKGAVAPEERLSSLRCQARADKAVKAKAPGAEKVKCFLFVCWPNCECPNIGIRHCLLAGHHAAQRVQL